MAQGDGIYADFNTSMGSFTCRLDYAVAPKAVANFIGLATGQRAWLDAPSGLVKTNPFFNGVTFHRVIAGFMSQSGSRNGLGTDGPGYSFVDEFSPSLRHDSFGILSMANSGPDSNGSQFFITAGPTPWLDDVHTVFGRVIGGSNVVYAINRVSTDSKDKPLTAVVIHSVDIRRVGPAAQAFDIHAQGLPEVTYAHSVLEKNGTNLTLTLGGALNADNRLYSSTNLIQWSGIHLGLAVGDAPPPLSVVPAGTARFFRAVQARYPQTLHVPANVLGRTATFNLTTGEVLTIGFDNGGKGTCTFNGNPAGMVATYNWIQDPYRGRLRPILFTHLVPMEIHMDFDSATSGTFKGTAYPNYPLPTDSFPIAGTFTTTP
ncbi:MAG TPA: peptidylprolyl isomerase [Verrucomicrobia bacterium]|nr:peptidylprolyl isomerase [Verrucomicrobiota bacterium]